MTNKRIIEFMGLYNFYRVNLVLVGLGDRKKGYTVFMGIQNSLDITQKSASKGSEATARQNFEAADSGFDITPFLEKKEQLKVYIAKIAALVNGCQSDFSREKNAQLFLQRILTSIDRLNALLDNFFEPSELAAHGLNRVRLRHDTGNSVNQIVGYAEMLQEDAEEAGATDFVCDLQQLQTMVYGLLDLINEVSGKVRPQTGALFLED